MTQFLKPVLILVILASSLFAKSKKVTWLPIQFKASFVSIDENIFTDEIKKTKGELSYKYPKRLKMEYNSDPKVIYTSNLSEIYLYTAPKKDPKLKNVPGELRITKGGRGDLMNFFDSLRVNGLNSNKSYKVTKKENVVNIIFTKDKAKQLKITKAKLSFHVSSKNTKTMKKGKKTNKSKQYKYDFKSLKALAVTLNSKKVVNYELDKIDTNVKLSKDYFVFKTPKNTNVERN
jgi:outer membrane lipoprotein-sorting protein